MTIPEEKIKVHPQSTEDTQPQTDNHKTLYDESLPKGQVIVFEATDKTKAYLKIVSTTSAEQFTKDEILEIINEIGIKSEINVNKIEEALATLKDQGDIVNIIKITDSVSSATSENTSVKILFSPDDPFVEEGEMVLKVSEAEKSGNDIYGNEISLINLAKSHITLGENIIEKTRGNISASALAGPRLKITLFLLKNFLKYM